MEPNKEPVKSPIDGDWKKAIHGIGAFLVSPWGSVIFVPLVSFLVGPIFKKLMDEPSPKTAIFACAGGITLAVWVLASVAILNLKPKSGSADSSTAGKGTSTSKPPPWPKPQAFKVRSSRAWFGLGSNGLNIGIPAAEGEKLSIIDANPPPVVIWVKDGSLRFDMTLKTQKGQNIVFRNNEMIDPPPSWDINSGENAFEVVDQQGTPVLQLVKKTETQILLFGEFVFAKGTIIADEENSIIDTHAKSATHAKLRKLFKYPSWKYPGVYLD
jgi:hypothetical protein